MSDALVRVLQARGNGKPTRLIRVAVTTTNPLTVTLPDGATIPGVAISGLTYTAGTAAVALIAEPGTPLVFPVEGTAPSVPALQSPPTATINTTIDGLTVTFDGSASTDPDGLIASYLWNFGDGTSGTDPTVVHTYAADGSYRAVLTVTDDKGAADSDTRTVVVTAVPTGTPPVASFTTTVTNLGVAVNASASSDADGGTLAYAWNYGDGSTGAGVTDSHTYTTAGQWRIVLTVTDDTALTGTTSHFVTVSDPPPTTPGPTPSPATGLYLQGSMYEGIPTNIPVYTHADLGLSTSVTNLQTIADAIGTRAAGIIQLPGGGWVGTIPNFSHHGSNYGINQPKLLGLLGDITGGTLNTQVRMAGKVLTATQLQTIQGYTRNVGNTQIGAYRTANTSPHYIAGINFVGADQQAVHDYTNGTGLTGPALYGGFFLNNAGANSVFQNCLIQGFGRSDDTTPPGEVGNWNETHTVGFKFRRVEADGRIPGSGTDPYGMAWRRGGGIQWNAASSFLVEDVYHHDDWTSGFTASFTGTPTATSKESNNYVTRRLRVHHNANHGTSSVTGQNSGNFRPINMEFNYGNIHHYQPTLDADNFGVNDAHIRMWMSQPSQGWVGDKNTHLYVHQPVWSTSSSKDNGCFSIYVIGLKSIGMVNPTVYLTSNESVPATPYIVPVGTQVPSNVTTANNYVVIKYS
jgi:PKD repeat protein